MARLAVQEVVKPISPWTGRYASSRMRKLCTIDTKRDYRHACSNEMREILSDKSKYMGWRDCWIALAESELEMGVEGITREQVDALKEARNVPIDSQVAKEYEQVTQHDVIAYRREFGDSANKILKGAGNILHRGATSADITDNAELASYKFGLELVLRKTNKLRRLAFGHPSLRLPLEELTHRISSIQARGLKGAVGTQDSYLNLLKDKRKVNALDADFSARLGFDSSYTETGQTYPRIVDYQILGSIDVLAQTLYKIAGPKRQKHLKAHAEAIHLKALQAAEMASQQWLERSLDDSAQRRVVMTESFYQIDHMLDELLKNPNGLKKPEKQVMTKLQKERLSLVAEKTTATISRMYDFAVRYRNASCIGFTHGQAAQPTTYGKRLSLWAYGFVLAMQDLENLLDKPQRYAGVSLDALINTRLNQIAIAAGKTSVDIRLLQRDLEVSEPYKKNQQGSSAMPHKRNPKNSERCNSLCRTKIGSTSMDRCTEYDFLATDSILELMLSTFTKSNKEQEGFTVYTDVARKRLEQYMPFFVSEHVLNAALKKKMDRDKVYKAIRAVAIKAKRDMRKGRPIRMLEDLAKRGLPVDLDKKAELLNPARYLGRAIEQVEDLFPEVNECRATYPNHVNIVSEVSV